MSGPWIDWAGGDCPVDVGTKVNIRLRGHKVCSQFYECFDADTFAWCHDGEGGDIVQYRLSKSVEVAQTESVKPSNPKDAIGIRKAPMSVIPANVLAEVGVAMLEGAAKYGRHNYRSVGVQASVYYDATMRHLMSWWEGEDLDPDSNLSHITKAIASLVVLRDAMMQDKVTDDRPPKCAPFYKDLNDKAAAILDKHADKSPKHITAV